MRREMNTIASFALAASLAAGLAATESKAADGESRAATVRASQFGWNGVDDTAALQRALDSGASKVIIDRQKGDWVTRPLFIRGCNREVVLEDGVTLRAKKGAFKKLIDSLVRIEGATNVTLRGEGKAKLVMLKKDYLDKEQYEFSEWRMGVWVGPSEGVVVRDLEIASSGGDGVYVNSPRNLRLENLNCVDHNRQGISLISVKGLVVKNCHFDGTYGAPPQAGLDYEPNNARNILQDIVFDGCVFAGNASSGVIFSLGQMRRSSPPISMTMRNCDIHGNNIYGFSIQGGGEPVKGTILLEGCKVYGNRCRPLSMMNLPPDAIKITIRDCTFDARDTEQSAIRFDNGNIVDDFAGVTFENVRVLLGKGKPYEFSGLQGVGLRDIAGAIDFVHPDGTVKTVTAKELMARHKPDPALRSFTPAVPDLRQLRPAYRGRRLPKPVASPMIRYSARFVQYVPGPGEYPVTLRYQIMRGRDLGAQVEVRSLGAEIETFTMTEREQVYVIKANGAGSNIYEFRMRSESSCKVGFTSSWPGNGILAYDRVNLLATSGRQMYFPVPAGAADAQVKFSPAPTEPASARLLDPNGVLIAEHPYQDGGMIMKPAAGATATPGLWTLELLKMYDDCTVQIGGGAIGVAAFAPEAAFTLKGLFTKGDYEIKANPHYQMVVDKPAPVAFTLYRDGAPVPGAALEISKDGLSAKDPKSGATCKAYADRSAEAPELEALAAKVSLPRHVNVLFLGDSLTHLDLGHNHLDKTEYFLNRAHPGKITFFNYACGGDSIVEVMERMEGKNKGKYWDRYADIWCNAYDWAFVSLGHNDTKAMSREDFKVPNVTPERQTKEYTRLIGLLREKGIRRIILVSSTCSNFEVCKACSARRGKKVHNRFGEPRHMIAFNETLQRIAAEQGVEYMDVYSDMSRREDRASLVNPHDGVHLTEKGHTYFSRKTLEYLAHPPVVPAR